MGKKDIYIGEEAQKNRGVLSLSYPIEHGTVIDWEGFELLLNHTFYNELLVDPKDHPVMLTEAPLNANENREKMAEILFETFETPSLIFQIQAILSLFGSGCTTGVVLDSGDGVTHIVPVYQGYELEHVIKRLDFAGRDLTFYLQQLLLERGIKFHTSAEVEIVRDMKEKLCYCSLDYEREITETGSKDMSYELPDGQRITIGRERFKCPEALFNPQKLMHREHGGLQDILHETIQQCGIDIKKELYNSIIVSGGTTLLRNFEVRLYKEMKTLAPASIKIKINASSDRRWAVWKGGSTLTQLSTFGSMWISRREYEEEGVSIVHRRKF
eukprot:gnl/Carplike_NY0171/6545_a8987_238.p1 GENE.gnl/Carplike_NY0171/6545_a8987_238~~gnl/Carplike_NY0171/6545_a8987_238.p1  ORF type:complete len:363 (-),score=61.85 gnl/Carplike_NY0171/6545_a8987_238:67-1050(-)